MTWRWLAALALLAAGCAHTVRADDYYAAPLERAATRTVPLEARWRVQPPPAGCGTPGAPMVFLPALGLTQHTWAGVTARLGACRARVLVDLPGIGESPFTGAFDDEAVLRALGDVVDAVAPGGRVVLAGHSLGGAIAARLADRLGARVEALVLVAAPVAPFTLNRWERFLLLPSLWPPFLHLAGISWGVRLGLTRVAGGGDRASPLDVGLIAADWSNHQRRGAIREYYRAFLDVAAVEKSQAALARLHLPVLLVWGADDEIVQRPVLLAAAARLAHARTVVVAGAGHMVPLTRPAEVAAAVDGFVTAPTSAPVAVGHGEVVAGRTPGSRVWGPREELFPLIGAGALFTLDGRTDLSFVAGVARGGVDRRYPVESGRLVLTAGAAVRGASTGWSFAYLRATGRLELVWRWGGGFHVDGTLLVDPRNGDVGGYGAVGYTPSVLPWTRVFLGGGALPGESGRLILGVEILARLTGWLF